MTDIAQGQFLEHLYWKDAEALLTNKTVVVIPIGAQSKEHGYHLPLNNDFLMAEYLKHAIAKRLPVVIAPTINYSFYPAMAEYPGSVSLKSETASSMFCDIVSSFARFGPRYFYFLNTGISTIRPLKVAAEALAREGMSVTYSDLRVLLQTVRLAVEEQEGGTHADEIETSIMLYMAPDVVKMEQAVLDFHGDGPGPFSRERRPDAVYSPSGAWGDPTKASKEKGERLVTALVDGIARDIKRIFENIESISTKI
ncbi:MAG: creatininase family protein [Candidatus Melainabacteria bacterium]|nr:creatininase family protein [Candidatus Melainabacteria bacterium]